MIYTTCKNDFNLTIKKNYFPKSVITFTISVFILLFTSSAVKAWNGKVVDKDTGEPIKGVVILRSWDRWKSNFLDTTRELDEIREVVSDKNGEFSIPDKISIPVSVNSGIEENWPVVFKPGYRFNMRCNKKSIIQLEKVSTLPSAREKECDEVWSIPNSGILLDSSSILMETLKRESEFYEIENENKELINRVNIWIRETLPQQNMKVISIPPHTDGKPKIRNNDPEKVKQLISQLKVDDRNIRITAADSLKVMDISNNENVDLLKTAIHHIVTHENEKIVLESVARIGAPLVPILFTQMKHENNESVKKIKIIISAIRDYDAVPGLILELNNNDPEIRKLVIMTLGNIQDTRAVDPLIAIMINNPDYRNAAEQALLNIRGTSYTLINALNNEDGDVRRRAAYILGFARDTKAVDQLITVLTDKDKDVRLSTVFALGCIRDVKAVNPLVTTLKDEDYTVRKFAVEALGKLKAPGTIEPLLASLKDPDPSVRETAVKVLAEMNDAKIIDALIQVWDDKDKKVRIKASEALLYIGQPAVKSLIAQLNNEKSYFRWRAAWALGYLSAPETLDFLFALLRDNVSEVKWITVAALGNMGDTRAIDELKKLLNDKDSGIIERAQKSIDILSGKGKDEIKIIGRDAYKPIKIKIPAGSKNYDRFRRR